MLKGYLSRASLGRVHAAARSKMYIVHAIRGMQMTLRWASEKEEKPDARTKLPEVS